MKKNEDAGNSITILRELKEYIIPLSEEQFSQLEQNILSEGCREPLIVWPKDDQLILVDGHNRFAICQKHGIHFKTRKVAFNDIDEVKAWMVDNQMGRRNLTPDQISYYRGLKYISMKKRKGGYENVQLKGNTEVTTSEFLAGQFSVSESTVKRDAKFAQGLNIIQRTNPKLKTKILTGEVKVKKSDVQALASAKDQESITIKNEADLYNKAKIIREEILKDVEADIKKIDKENMIQAQEKMREFEPVFLTREDRLRKIKGMIVSAINRAINDRDADAIQELKKLIDRLEDELFD